MSFGSKIKELRTKSKMTQKDLSLILDVSSSTIGMYEQDRREPDIKTIILIAKYFNVSTDFLFELKQSKKDQLFSYSEHEQRLVFAYRTKPEMQPAVDTILGIGSDKLNIYNAAETKNKLPDKYIKMENSRWEEMDKTPSTDEDLL